MTVREYIGARYIPIFDGQWDSTKAYEPLTIVQYQGNSYTSRQFVPIDTAITDENFWLESGNYNAQIEAYRQEVLEIANKFPVKENDIDSNAINTEKIADSSVTFEKLSAEVKSMSSSFDNSVIDAFVDGVNGDDDTAIINDSTKPFKTLQKALDEMDIITANFRIHFLTGGTYTMTPKIFYGSVIHFFANNTNSSVTINVVNDADVLYLYDTHINFNGSANYPLIFNITSDDNVSTDRGMLKVEGSTIWAVNTIFNLKRIYLIQGSSYFNNCTINGYVYGIFADLRIRETTINNVLNISALYMICGTLRIEATNNHGLWIGENNLATNKAAINVYSCLVALNAFVHPVNKVRTNYNYFLDARSCTISAPNSLMNEMDDYATNGYTITTQSNLITETSRFETTGYLRDIVIPANSYVDTEITLPYTFPIAPYVLLTPHTTGTEMNVTCSYYGQSTDGFTIRINNHSQSNPITLSVAWLAIV